MKFKAAVNAIVSSRSQTTLHSSNLAEIFFEDSYDHISEVVFGFLKKSRFLFSYKKIRKGFLPGPPL